MAGARDLALDIADCLRAPGKFSVRRFPIGFAIGPKKPNVPRW